MPPRGSEFKVGLLILAALGVLAVGIFLIGDRNNLFARKNEYYIEFDSVSGLKPGSPVQLDGVEVGAVKRVVLPQDPKREHIQVWIRVDSQYEERIRGPQGPRTGPGTDPGTGSVRPATNAPPASVARIKTLGLLGDKFIEVSSGSTQYPTIPEDGMIPAAEPTNVDALISSGEDVMDNVVEISHSLSTILNRMERGEGLLGELTTDSPSGRRLKESLIGTSETLERIATKVETGDGPLPRLLNDREMADRLVSSLDRFETLLASAQSGPGLLPGLLNDPSMRVQAQETLTSLNQVARELHAFTADLDTSDALLPRLVKDEEYGREVTGQVRKIVDNLSTVSERLTNGPGTVPKLINDPQIYDAVNDVIIGINESKLLRWLIRNRQKAGIEKRYKDTKAAMEAAGQTPPPLDEGSDPTATETPPPGLLGAAAEKIVEPPATDATPTPTPPAATPPATTDTPPAAAPPP